jgi:SET domain-containing protein
LSVQFVVAVPLSTLVRRRSHIAGWGVYTRLPITKNTRIIHYAGEKISHRESARRERRQLARGEVWCFTVNRRWVRDAEVGGNLARFINHSCQPNCYVEIAGDTIWIRASRNLAAGEELTYDYRTDGEALIACRCRPGCTTKL